MTFRTMGRDALQNLIFYYNNLEGRIYEGTFDQLRDSPADQTMMLTAIQIDKIEQVVGQLTSSHGEPFNSGLHLVTHG